jgi:hypothetical protein
MELERVWRSFREFDGIKKHYPELSLIPGS